jgi:hypothetical protein
MAITHTMTFDTNILIAYLGKEESAFSSCKHYKGLGFRQKEIFERIRKAAKAML